MRSINPVQHSERKAGAKAKATAKTTKAKKKTTKGKKR